jgi:hypothetical protein
MLLSRMTSSHQKAKDEAINIAKIHEHIKNNTPSGIKIKNAFTDNLSQLTIFDSTIISGANRTTHHDLQIVFNDILKTVEFKGSKHFKPIGTTKAPWVNGVQFYNGTGNKFKMGQLYAQCFYEKFIDKIINDLNIKTPKPSYEEWAKDAFRQGKPKTPFVIELREKGYCSDYLSNIRKEFNKSFNPSIFQLTDLMIEVQTIANEVLNCKDFWLQIHGDIDDPQKFYVKWTNKITMPEIISVEQIKTKDNCDINFKFICNDNSEFYAKMRWGYGQCITNIRIDIK